MDETKRKYKGRLCFRAPTTRDERGAYAVFQDLASRPTIVVATNVNVFYGALPGNKTTVADAVRAYVQSLLKSKHRSFVELPKELWPKEWHGKYTNRLACLYGPSTGTQKQGRIGNATLQT